MTYTFFLATKYCLLTAYMYCVILLCAITTIITMYYYYYLLLLLCTTTMYYYYVLLLSTTMYYYEDMLTWSIFYNFTGTEDKPTWSIISICRSNKLLVLYEDYDVAHVLKLHLKSSHTNLRVDNGVDKELSTVWYQ